jgi:hypothetical protein
MDAPVKQRQDYVDLNHIVSMCLHEVLPKPSGSTVRVHEDQWDGTEYNLYSPRLEPRGPEALPPPLPKDEYSVGNVLKKEANIFAEYTDLYGFVAKSAYQGLFPDTRSLHPAAHKNLTRTRPMESQSTILIEMCLFILPHTKTRAHATDRNLIHDSGLSTWLRVKQCCTPRTTPR